MTSYLWLWAVQERSWRDLSISWSWKPWKIIQLVSVQNSSRNWIIRVVDLSDPKAVSMAMIESNAIIYRIELDKYTIYSKSKEVALSTIKLWSNFAFISFLVLRIVIFCNLEYDINYLGVFFMYCILIMILTLIFESIYCVIIFDIYCIAFSS